MTDRTKTYLRDLHPLVRLLVCKAHEISPLHIKHSVISGFRSTEEQKKLYDKGASKRDGLHRLSYHQAMIFNIPSSLAIDFIPLRTDGTFQNEDWNDTQRFSRIAAIYQAAAKTLGVAIEWGGDWNSDTFSTDETFRDYGHIQLVGDVELLRHVQNLDKMST